MLRFEVREDGGDQLPALDLEDPVVVIGSGAEAKIRLPAGTPTVRVRADEVGDGKTYELGRYRVRVSPSPAGAVAASPQRTESLARELVRSLLGTGAAPALEVETGPRAGARRMLAPPESQLVIGRGDDAGWIVDDEELSRAHAEVRRGWDGAWLRDLGSKNGTRLDGRAVGNDEVELRDGARIELGKMRVRFADPAERHLRGEQGAGKPEPRSSTSKTNSTHASSAVFYVALLVCVLALGGLVWVLL